MPNMWDVIDKFQATKDSAKMVSTVKDTDKTVAARIPELNEVAGVYAKLIRKPGE